MSWCPFVLLLYVWTLNTREKWQRENHMHNWSTVHTLWCVYVYIYIYFNYLIFSNWLCFIWTCLMLSHWSLVNWSKWHMEDSCSVDYGAQNIDDLKKNSHNLTLPWIVFVFSRNIKDSCNLLGRWFEFLIRDKMWCDFMW